MARKIVRRPEVEERTGLSGRTIDRREAAGHFPRRVRLGRNLVGWHEDEIDEWIESRPRAKTDDSAADTSDGAAV